LFVLFLPKGGVKAAFFLRQPCSLSADKSADKSANKPANKSANKPP